MSQARRDQSLNLEFSAAEISEMNAVLASGAAMLPQEAVTVPNVAGSGPNSLPTDALVDRAFGDGGHSEDLVPLWKMTVEEAREAIHHAPKYDSSRMNALASQNDAVELISGDLEPYVEEVSSPNLSPSMPLKAPPPLEPPASIAMGPATSEALAEWNTAPKTAPDDAIPVGINEERTGEIEYEALEFETEMIEVKRAPPPPPAPTPPRFDFDERQPDSQSERRRGKWFEETFDEDYVRTGPRMTEAQTKREADFIQQTIGGVSTSMTLLDIGCGTGRHALELASRGHQVTALDLSLPLLLKAAEQARRDAATVNFVHGDMRTLAFENEYDAAYCMSTTFGYFDDETNRNVLANIARALKPNGRVLLDLCNRDYLVPNLPTRVWWEGDGCVVLEEVEFNFATSRLQVQRSIVFDDGRQKDQDISIRAYSLHEIGRLLHLVGLRTLEVSGGMALRGKFFGSDSRQLLIVAEKR